MYCTIDGNIRIATPVGVPEDWTRLQTQEQRQQTPEAQQARREQRRWRGW
jgi:hypothetical protein